MPTPWPPWRQSSAAVPRGARDSRSRPYPSGAPVPPPFGSGQFVGDLWRDVRYAARLLRRTPGFTAAAVVTLALGIGMTTAIFSVVQAVLLRPAPFPEGDRLVMMWETDRNSSTTREPASVPDFLDYRERSRQVERVGSFEATEMNLLPDAGDPRRLPVLAATPGLMQLLGVTALAGRLFAVEEIAPAARRSR
jgi:hypothetical protein